MTACILCMDSCDTRYHPPSCTCFYYIHHSCQMRVATQLPFGCMYCRVVTHSPNREQIADEVNLDDIISFEYAYFLFVGNLVGTTIIGGVFLIVLAFTMCS